MSVSGIQWLNLKWKAKQKMRNSNELHRPGHREYWTIFACLGIVPIQAITATQKAKLGKYSRQLKKN